jgi:hypothetical protein
MGKVHLGNVKGPRGERGAPGVGFGYRTLTTASAMDNTNTVKINKTQYNIAEDELAGYWIQIGDYSGYVGSNSTDTLRVYTDKTMSQALSVSYVAGETVYLIGKIPNHTDVGAAPAYATKSMNACTTLKEIYNLFGGDYSVRLHGEVGALQNTNLKTLLGSGLAGARAFNTNYIDVYAELIGNNAGTVRLTAVDATNADNVAYGYIYFNPNLSRGGWGGWQTADYRIVDNVMEWINPPMIVGEEYRTTERWQGKPVYVKAINIASVGEGTVTIGHGITGISGIVSVRAVVSTAGGEFAIPWYKGTGYIFATATRDSVMTHASTEYVGKSAIVTIKYTK